MTILVTGGAGFIGSHTVDELLARGHKVRILDNLSKPVHLKGMPSYIPDDVEFIKGDVRDRATMEQALSGVDAVYHLAAYQDYLPDFSTFFEVNAVGTALLFELIVEKKLPIKKVIVASSQSVAGEGLYRDSDGTTFLPDCRPIAQLEKGHWDICDAGGFVAESQPTPETVSNPQNPYGISKLSQERIAIHLGKRYEISTVAMRYSIVQGPRQSFYNAYSGACRIFCLNMFFGRMPPIYEDGQQIRDFVNIHDVVDANVLVLEDDRADFRVFNVGGGYPYTVLEFAHIVAEVFGVKEQPVDDGLFRFGDTRHILSDISALKSLGWAPQRTARNSVNEYADYLRQQADIDDIMAYAEQKMKDLNVVRKASST